MEKSSNSKYKDRLRTAGKHFEYIPATWGRRVTAAGVTFGGKYVSNKRKTKKKDGR